MAEDKPSPPTAAEGFRLLNSQGFPMNYGYREVNRLNLQHFLWRESFRFSIHPSIQPQLLSNAPNNANLSIADVACGTSLWLADVARELPQAELDGLDVCLTQATNQHWLPSNITLHEWNILNKTVPSELVGKYDLVHVRSLALALAGKDPKTVIRNLYQLVRPGGYLQWEESDYKSMCVKKIDQAVETPALEELVKLHYSEGRHDWTLGISQLLSEEGFQHTQEEHFDDKHELVRAFHYHHLLRMDEFGLAIIRMGKPDVAARLFKLVHDAAEEHGRGASLSIPRLVVVANKPQATS
ncbi:hypothetical protein BBP40_007734 [Aspergillus hancockii]|nr:hypothetical protein BBP40_007734 [Aspergillus hancockii]